MGLLSSLWSPPPFDFLGEYQTVTIDFKGSHNRSSIIQYAVFFHVRYAASYPDLEEIMAERGTKSAMRP